MRNLYWHAIVILALVLLALFFSGLPLDAQEIVDPRSGRLLLTVTDLVVPAGPVILEVQRSFDPRGKEQRLLGTRWRLQWEGRLFHYGELLVIEEGAATFIFERDAGKPEYTSSFGDRVVFGTDGRGVRTRLDETRDTFDPQGRLVERDLRNGNLVRLRYGADGRLTRIEGPRGTFLQFTADASGRLVSIESSIGKTVRYGYTGGELTEVQVGVAPPVRYAYDVDGRLARIEHPATGPVEIAYDPKGRVASRRWADGSQESYEYDDTANTVRHLDPVGAATTIQWSADKRQAQVTSPLGHKTAMTYDEAGRLLSVTGPTGATVRLTYDRLGRLLTAQNPAGPASRFDYAGATSRVVAITRPDASRQTFDYDAQGNVTAVKVGGTLLATLTYHPDGSLASMNGVGEGIRNFTYRPDGRLQSSTNALGETTRFEYDARGNLTRTINPLGGVTTRRYDAQDRLIALTDPAGTSVGYEYDPEGLLRRVIDPAGGITRYEYDARGRLVAETNPAGQTIRYEYDPRGLLARRRLPDGRSQTFTRDAAASVTSVTDLLGGVTRLEYDAQGRVSRERDPAGLERTYARDAVGNVIRLGDALAGGGTLEYDPLGRLVAFATATGGKVRYGYDAVDRLTALTDPLGHIKQLIYDTEGRLAGVVEPDGSRAGYAYDLAGRLSVVRHPGGGETRFAYDALGNPVKTTDALGREFRSAYDSAGRLVGVADAKGRTTGFAYDRAGRLSEKRLPDGRRVTYQYDSRGQILRIDDGAFPVVYTYDGSGRRTSIEYPAIKRTLRYEYNAAGLCSRFIDSEGGVIEYDYDAAGRLTLMRLPGGQAFTFAHDSKGRITTMRYPNGIIGRGEYDADSRLIRLAYADQAGKTIGGWRHSYDAAGNVVETTDHDGWTVRYRYDPAGQLLEETDSAGGSITYGYLPGGNRAQRDVRRETVRYRYDAGNRLLEAGGETFTHDVNGNLVERRSAAGATRYEYDAQGQLVKVTRPDGGEVTFGYAPTGERIWRRDANGTTYFVTDGVNLISELDENLKARATYVHRPLIDAPLAMTRDGRTYFYHLDRLGSVRTLSGEQGQVVAGYDYDAFGQLRQPLAPIENAFTYTSREWDPAVGLYHYRARYYDAGLGRFLSLDPAPPSLVRALELNPYLYVQNNPVRFTDPLGLGPWGTWTYPAEEMHWLQESIRGDIEGLKDLTARVAAGGEDPTNMADWLRNQIQAKAARIAEVKAQNPGVTPRPTPKGLDNWRPPDPEPPIQSVVGRPTGQANATQKVPVVKAPAATAASGEGAGVSAGGVRAGGKAGGGVGVNLLPKNDVEGLVGKGPGRVGVGVLLGVDIATAKANYDACRDEGKSPADCLNEIKDALKDPWNWGIMLGTAAVSVLVPPLGAGIATGLTGAGMVGAAERSGNAAAVKAEAARRAWWEAHKGQFDALYANLAGEIAAQLGPPRQAAFDARGQAREQARAARAAADQARELLGALRGLRDALQQVAGDCAIVASMLRGQILAAATEAKNDQTSMLAKIASANAKAAACTTKEDADEIGRLEGEIKDLAAKGTAAAGRAGDLWVQLQGILQRAEVARESLGAAEKNAAEITRQAGIAKAAASASQDAAKQVEDKAAELDKKKPVLLARISAFQSTFDFPEAVGRIQALIGHVTNLASLPGEDTRSVWTGAQDDADRAAGFDSEAQTLLAAMRGLPLCQGITSPDDAVNNAPSTGAFADAGGDLAGKIQVCLAKLTTPPPTLRTLAIACSPTEAEIGQLVTCTASGAYSDNPSMLVDLSGGATVWETGPQFTAVSPQPTYTVKATRDGITATTIVKLKEYNPATDPLAAGGFGAGPVKIPDLPGLGGMLPGSGSGGQQTGLGGLGGGSATGQGPYNASPGSPTDPASALPGSAGAQPIPGSLPPGTPCGVIPYPPCPPAAQAGGSDVRIPLQGLLPSGSGMTGGGPGGGSSGGTGAGTTQPPAAPPATPPTTGGPSCGPVTHCTCAGGGKGHIPCDRSLGSCHCGGG